MLLYHNKKRQAQDFSNFSPLDVFLIICNKQVYMIKTMSRIRFFLIKVHFFNYAKNVTKLCSSMLWVLKH